MTDHQRSGKRNTPGRHAESADAVVINSIPRHR